jgi:release factor glutamine methyltransferase
MTERGGDRAPDADAPLTWKVLLAQTTATVGDPTHARWLCEVASSAMSADEFLTMLDEPATTRMVVHLDAMVERYRGGEPIQYVLGTWSFRRIELAIDSRVLIPRPETELVAEVALEKASGFGPTRTVADLGTGSGAIGLALADELPRVGTTVWITDVDSGALDVARANIAGIGNAGVNVRTALGSWCDALPSDVQFDTIVANPPYVAVGSPDLEPVVADWEPARALFAGGDGLDDIRIIVSAATGHLVAGGWLVLEIGADQGHAVSRLLLDAGYLDIEIRADLAGNDRIAIGRTPPDVPDIGDRVEPDRSDSAEADGDLGEDAAFDG